MTGAGPLLTCPDKWCLLIICARAGRGMNRRNDLLPENVLLRVGERVFGESSPAPPTNASEARDNLDAANAATCRERS